MSAGAAIGATADAPSRAMLRALGGLSLEPLAAGQAVDAESRAMSELATRRRKVALLLYLARQTKPVSRELLATLLWGEEPPEKARHNLTEALSHIRRACGRDAIGSRVQDVELSPNCPVDVDVRQFEAALASGELARAGELYAGPFLAGVFLERAPAFDDWVARERARLSARFVALCRERMPQLMAEGRWADAASLAERWLEEDPEDAEAGVALLSALAGAGTRAELRAAVERYRRLRTRLQAEFESEPEAQVTSLSAAHEAALATLPDSPPTAPAEAVPMGRRPASVSTETEPAPDAPATPVHVATMRRLPYALAAAVLLCLVAWAALRPRATEPAPRTWILVADTQDPAHDPITEASVTMVLGVALAQSEALNVVSRDRIRDVLRLMRRPDSTFVDEQTALEIANRIGAGRVIVPSIARLGSQRSLAVRTLEVATGRTLGVDQTSAVTDDALLPALDALASNLRSRLGAAPRAAEQIRPLPEVTTASLGALRAYTAANAFLRRAAHDSAIVAYQQAIALDSSFATAYAGLGQLLHYLNRPADGERALERALALRNRLSAREAMRNEAMQARWRRLPDSAIAIQARWLAANPRDRDTKSSLAYDLLQGRQNSAARDAYLALLATDSLDARDWVNLAVAAGGLDTDADRRVASRAYARAFVLDSTLRTDVIQNNEYGSLLVRAGLPDSAATIFRMMLGGPPAQAARGYRSLGLLALWRNDSRRAVALFDSAAAAHRAVPGEALGEVRARLFLAWSRREAGDEVGARAELARVQALSRAGVAEPTVLYWAGKAMARSGMTDAAREMLDTLARRVVNGNRRHESARHLLAGEVEMAAGRAAQAVSTMERGVALDSSDVARESLAHALRRAGATARADSLYRTVAAARRFGTEAMLAQRAAIRATSAGPP
jgi:DNA-binding SARP family transcriptional activator/Tfp pilus assembly protein PilF